MSSSATPATKVGAASSAVLLDDEGMVSDQLLAVLGRIFSKYCTPAATWSATELPPRDAYLSPDGLDRFASATNGAPFDGATKADIALYFDAVEPSADGPGGLSWPGFEQMFTLQSENDPDETFKDLAAHGFDRSLQFVGTSQ